jgi:hypothetical protein
MLPAITLLWKKCSPECFHGTNGRVASPFKIGVATNLDTGTDSSLACCHIFNGPSESGERGLVVEFKRELQ